MNLLPLAPRKFPRHALGKQRALGISVVFTLVCLVGLIPTQAWLSSAAAKDTPRLIALTFPWMALAVVCCIYARRREKKWERVAREGREVHVRVTSVLRGLARYAVECVHPLAEDERISIEVMDDELAHPTLTPAIHEGDMVLLLDPADPKRYLPVSVEWAKSGGAFVPSWPIPPLPDRTRSVLGDSPRKIGTSWRRQWRQVHSIAFLVTLFLANAWCLYHWFYEPPFNVSIENMLVALVAGGAMAQVVLFVWQREQRKLFEQGIEMHATRHKAGEPYAYRWGPVELRAKSLWMGEPLTLDQGRTLVLIADRGNPARHVVVARSMLD